MNSILKFKSSEQRKTYHIENLDFLLMINKKLEEENARYSITRGAEHRNTNNVLGFSASPN
ncbi:MAG: hypothetical protein B6D64_11995 [Bacteroidetes bacterium 4484_276]|nr:MAG: hypothetical protein B6D64_11995 [Bacteroidetes bacterium 4484_276]OYT13031.1 MAG: hypothetical protein B6I19_07230 [Bacteroidetes bacterium 4572_114]